jgi:chromosome segregation ATPase
MDHSLSTPDDHRALRDALEAFETRLATPVVSGELKTWAAAVSQAWATLAVEVKNRLEHHQEQLATIANQDPELLPRVEQLKGEDESIRRDIETLSTTIERLTPRAEKVEPHEGRLGAEVEAASAQGIAFVNRIRKQEVALRTWFQEAFNRDRGVAAD